MTTTPDPTRNKRGKGSSNSKRKLDTVDKTVNGAESSKQQRIATLFSQTSQSKEAPPAEPRTPTKRQKFTQEISPKPANKLDAMYNFTSKTNTKTVVDLTANGSPPRHYPSSGRPTGFAPHAGAKKLVVKNIRTTPRVQPNEYYEKVWGQLDTALTEIYIDGKPRTSLEELYKGAENVCRQGKAPELYQKLMAKCQAHITDKVRGTLASTASHASAVEFLKDLVSAWSTWKKQLVTIRSIFFYMDQSYLLRSSEHPGINEMGLLQFRRTIFGDKNLAAKGTQGVADLTTSDRMQSSSTSNGELLLQAIATYHDLGVYPSIFEPAFSALSADYLRSWSSEQASKNDLAEYAQQASDLIKREMARCDHYGFDRSTKKSISDQIDLFVVKQQVEFMTQQDSLLDLLEANNVEALRQVFVLLQRIGRGTEIMNAFQSFVVDEGSTIVFDEKRETEMVVRLLELKHRLDNILKVAFQGNHALADAMHRSIEQFINQTKKTASNWGTDNPKPGEMIAKHVDALLRGGLKAIPTLAPKSDTTKTEEAEEDEGMADEDAEINKQLDLVLDLFRFVHGKAVFEAFYKKDLARRLLMGRSASNDAERSMLARLKNGKDTLDCQRK